MEYASLSDSNILSFVDELKKLQEQMKSLQEQLKAASIKQPPCAAPLKEPPGNVTVIGAIICIFLTKQQKHY